MALQSEYAKLFLLIDTMMSINKDLPCFVGGDHIRPQLQNRLFPLVKGKKQFEKMNKPECQQFIDQ